MKVLLVDDSVKRAEIIIKWLSDNILPQEAIEWVTTSSEARAKVSRGYYDVLLLDVVLPKRNDDVAKWINGIDLLNFISSSARVKKPEKIIGITAYTDDIASFRDRFEEHCLSVIEVRLGDITWQPKFAAAFSYTVGSQLARVHSTKNVSAITVHGIRTYGQWQERLKRLVKGKADFINFFSYKYGYFPTLYFVFPFLRSEEVLRFERELVRLHRKQPEAEFVIFSHSFGSYIVANAIKQLIAKNFPIRIKTLVLSGSMLRSDFDWSFIDCYPDIKIINECGSNDVVLLLSEALVPNAGMAGRTGFYGISSDNLLNRYHRGGHSLYFEGDTFMEDKWFPILTESNARYLFDERENTPFLGNRAEVIASYLGRFGLYILLLLIFLISFLIWLR